MKYTIKKGNHFADFTLDRLFPFVGKYIHGTVIFSKECLTMESIPGLNKLTGISGLNNHFNSGRLAWQSNGKEINIYGYVYNKETRDYKIITTIDAEKHYQFSVRFVNGYWLFSINGKQITMKGDLKFWKIRNYVYFGGKSVAPCDMTITVS